MGVTLFRTRVAVLDTLNVARQVQRARNGPSRPITCCRLAPVDAVDLDPDPMEQLRRWQDEARAAGEPFPDEMVLATADGGGGPSARMVILRGRDHGLVFFTDFSSAKGADLAANPRAAAILHWHVPVHRQVRVT